jgi:thiopeptide-type bacteriocin biosynthesis protein
MISTPLTNTLTGIAMTDLQHTGPEWLYYKLYLAENHERAEQALLRLGAGVRQLADCQRWFFIRYVDQGGMHLRLRLLPVDGGADRLKADAQALLARVSAELHSYPPSRYTPMVTTPEMARSDKSVMIGKGGQRIETALYEPEHEKYGAPGEIAYAEQLFQASSAIALAVLADEAAERYSRKSLVPYLMRACHECFAPAPARKFWNHYAMFWLGGESPAASDWHAKFMNKAEQLSASGAEICGPDSALAPAALEQLQAWRAALAQAREAYLAHPKRSADIGVLCFNFTHMMNNRLGLSSLEETYMATMLEQCELQVAA